MKLEALWQTTCVATSMLMTVYDRSRRKWTARTKSPAYIKHALKAVSTNQVYQQSSKCSWVHSRRRTHSWCAVVCWIWYICLLYYCEGQTPDQERNTLHRILHLGFAAPFMLMAKKLLQDLCREEKLKWDDKFPELYRNRWERWQNKLPLLERLYIDRCVKPSNFGEVKSREIHIFSDGSATDYGSAAYLHLCKSKSRIHCSFLMGKARLAPIKVMMIPRLELTVAVLVKF